MDNVQVRPAKRGDMKYVHELIKELATFEKMPHRVEITEDILERDAFDLKAPLFSCYVAETEGSKIIGYALYYNTYSTWLGKAVFLEDLYVKPEFRKMGVGKKMFLAVAKEAYLFKTRLDFQVLSWNPAMDFYKKLGATNLTETEKWNSLRLDLNALNNIFEKQEQTN